MKRMFDRNKKMFLRAVAGLLALLLLAAAMTGCGEREEEKPEKKTERPTEQATEKQTEVSTEEKEPEAEEGMVLPASSSDVNAKLAKGLLSLCTGLTAENTARIFAEAGFAVVHQAHFDKDPQSTEDTCAYTVGKGKAVVGGTVRPAILIAIRGTSGGEWISNFNVAPTGNYTSDYADNFYACATDVYQGSVSFVEAEENPVVILCGHSRGAAAANLLGLFYNDKCGAANVYAYTYATPTTVRTSAIKTPVTNIFNFINPEDIVPVLPLPGWGFGRAGVDITLIADEEQTAKIGQALQVFLAAAPTVESYYTVKHALNAAGTSPMGISVYQLMSMLAPMLSSSGTGTGTGAGTGTGTGTGAGASPLSMVSPQSDLFPVIMGLSAVLMPGADGTSGMAAHAPVEYLIKIMAWEKGL